MLGHNQGFNPCGPNKWILNKMTLFLPSRSSSNSRAQKHEPQMLGIWESLGNQGDPTHFFSKAIRRNGNPIGTSASYPHNQPGRKMASAIGPVEPMTRGCRDYMGSSPSQVKLPLTKISEATSPGTSRAFLKHLPHSLNLSFSIFHVKSNGS